LKSLPESEASKNEKTEEFLSEDSLPTIRCTDLKKIYDGSLVAVRRINLEVNRGECFGLLGPNGAGKTSTIEILEGLMPQTSGTVEILGHEWGHNDQKLRQRIGISLQETRLSEKLTVKETIRLFRSFYHNGISPEKAIELISLNSKADVQVGKLSGGQRQRLAIACALVGDPELLFLDEPTNGLDPQARRQVWTLIRDVQQRGCTVLITTHYMDEAERLCDRVAIIDRGEIIAMDSPIELINSLGGDHIIEFALIDPKTQTENTPVDKGESQKSKTNGKIHTVLEEWDSVKKVRQGEGGFMLTVRKPHIVIPALLELLKKNELEIIQLSTRSASLEDVFVNLTGRHLRDGGAEEFNATIDKNPNIEETNG